MQKDLLRLIRLTFLGLLTRRKSQIICQNKTIVMIRVLYIGASQVNIAGVYAMTRKKFWNVYSKIGEDGKSSRTVNQRHRDFILAPLLIAESWFFAGQLRLKDRAHSMHSVHGVFNDGENISNVSC